MGCRVSQGCAGCLAALAVLAGCAGGLPAEPRDPPQLREAVASAAAQAKRCYRQPKVAFAGRQIVTRLRVRLTEDGRLAGVPTLVWQGSVTPANRPYAARMAEAAMFAVIRCAPFRLPPELHHGGWEELELTFSPRALA
jgi:hypothetical protein